MKKMEWKELSDEAGCILERCWNMNNDNPTSFSVVIGKPFKVLKRELIPTEETYKEILKYRKTNPEFDVKRDGNTLIVKGNCEFGSWSD
jgi:hypothetical protein